MSSTTTRTALVIGASGITGWALLREVVGYPDSTAFQRVIALFNRHVTQSELFLPRDDRVALITGFDLDKGVKDVITALEAIDGIQDVTDVYFAAYMQPPGTSDFKGFELLKEVNVRLLETAVQAVERVSPRLKFWTLQTGGKSYGFVHALQIGLPKVPCKESDPRIPQPFADQVFYYAQYDALQKLSAGKTWRFAEIRPDLVIGFVPGGRNAMNLAQALGIYLSFYADQEHGANGKKKIPFPGSTASYRALHTEVGQKTLARAHIFASSLPNAANGEVYNVGDSPLTSNVSWKDKWAPICEYFSLEGVGPDETQETSSVTEYMAQHQSAIAPFEKKYGLRPGIVSSCSWEFLEVMLSLATFDRHYNLSKLYAAGYQDRANVIQNYVDTFDLMKQAKMVPSHIIPTVST